MRSLLLWLANSPDIPVWFETRQPNLTRLRPSNFSHPDHSKAGFPPAAAHLDGFTRRGQITDSIQPCSVPADIKGDCTLNEPPTAAIDTSHPHAKRLGNPQFLAIISPEIRAFTLESNTHPEFAFEFWPDISNAAFLFSLSGLVDNKNGVTQPHF